MACDTTKVYEVRKKSGSEDYEVHQPGSQCKLYEVKKKPGTEDYEVHQPTSK